MGAFFSIKIRGGVKKFGSHTPLFQSWCLVPELVFDLYVILMLIINQTFLSLSGDSAETKSKFLFQSLNKFVVPGEKPILFVE
jgi:hypothetical protein